MEHEYWLDIGAGMDAEHWASTAAPERVRRVAIDPLLTSGMVQSGRLAPLPPDIFRIGAEIRPVRSVEHDKQRAYLPFRDAVFQHVHCGFMLHLYLETLEVLVTEAHRVLLPGGTFQVLVPHFGDGHSESILFHTEAALRKTFPEVRLEHFQGPFTTFWADLYRDRTYSLCCRKGY